MNKITILAISAVFVASILAITAFEAEAKPPAQSSACAVENVQHWTRVGLILNGDVIHPTLTQINNGRIAEIKIPTTQEELLDFRNSIIDRLNSLGYTKVGGAPLEDNSIQNILAVDYSIICAEN